MLLSVLLYQYNVTAVTVLWLSFAVADITSGEEFCQYCDIELTLDVGVCVSYAHMVSLVVGAVSVFPALSIAVV